MKKTCFEDVESIQQVPIILDICNSRQQDLSEAARQQFNQIKDASQQANEERRRNQHAANRVSSLLFQKVGKFLYRILLLAR